MFTPLFDPEGFRVAVAIRELRTGWLGYLARFPWSHVAVLTPRFDISVDRILSECSRFSRRLERMAQQRGLGSQPPRESRQAPLTCMR